MSCGCDNNNSGRPDQDTRLDHAQEVRGLGDPVLGPVLGSGFSGSGIGSGFGRVGGGVTPAATHAASPDPVPYPQVRVDIHFDYSTPKLIFQRRDFGYFVGSSEGL